MEFSVQKQIVDLIRGQLSDSNWISRGCQLSLRVQRVSGRGENKRSQRFWRHRKHVISSLGRRVRSGPHVLIRDSSPRSSLRCFSCFGLVARWVLASNYKPVVSSFNESRQSSLVRSPDQGSFLAYYSRLSVLCGGKLLSTKLPPA